MLRVGFRVALVPSRYLLVDDFSNLCLPKTSGTRKMSDVAKSRIRTCSDKILTMIVSLQHLLGWMVSVFSSREGLVLENLALRQQLLAPHVKRPGRRLTARHKLFWVALRSF